MAKDDEESLPRKVTDIDALKENSLAAVDAFAERWLSMPSFTERCEVMDQAALRDAMGLRSTQEGGDPWPAAEQQLLARGFRWHWLGNMRVMYLEERDDYCPDDGWSDGEILED